MPALINLIPAGVLAAICAWTDLKSMTIYNRHTYTAAAVGAVYSLATAQYMHLYGALIIFGMYFFLYILGRGRLGGGDLKLAVALSLFLGYDPVVLGSLISGVVLMTWGFGAAWLRTGHLKAGVLVAMGKLPGGDLPYGAVLGPSSVLSAVLLFVIK